MGDPYPFQKSAQTLQAAVARWADAAFGNIQTLADFVIVGLAFIQEEQMKEFLTTRRQMAKRLRQRLLTRPAAQQFF